MRQLLRVSLLFIMLISAACGGGETAQVVEETEPVGIDKAAVIDSVLKSKFDEGFLNGTVLVAEAGEVIYSNSFGLGNFETQDSLKINSCFRTVAVSLQMTAIAVLMLHDEKKLDLDDEVSKYFPELNFKGVKIRHLLSHTSGIPDYPEYFYTEGREEVVFNEDVMDMLVRKQPELKFNPGDESEYSDSGFIILAQIVSKVSGMDFKEFLVEKMFKPLGMNNTYPSSGDPDQEIPNRVFGHDEYKKKIDFDVLIGVVGDGGVYSTVEDLYKWDQAMYTEKLVSKQMLAEAFTLSILNDGVTQSYYGFGVEIIKKRGNTIISSEGKWVGFYANMRRNLVDKNLVIFLTNNNKDPAWMMNIVDDILAEKYFL